MIELAPGAENNAFATMLADLLRQNLESKPHKRADFDALRGSVALIADVTGLVRMQARRKAA